MTDDTLLPFDLPSVRRKKLTIDFDGGNQSSDGGLLLLREAERQLGVCRRLAEGAWPRPPRLPSQALELAREQLRVMAQSVDPTQPREAWRFGGTLIPFE